MKCKGEIRVNREFIRFVGFVTMLIDHVGLVLLAPYIKNLYSHGDPAFISVLLKIYRILRGIGRISFPLFAFMLVEGALNTGNRKNYFIRLLIFAVLSEPVFDLAVYDRLYYPQYQDVIWTFLIGVVMIWSCERARLLGEKGIFLELAVFGLSCLLAHFGKTDYHYIGIILIYILYRFRYERLLAVVTGAAVYLALTEFVWSLPAFFLMYFYRGRFIGHKSSYNGDRNYLKHVDYIIYPLHFLLFYGIRCYCIGA